jgi:hypothetical protein
MFNSPSDPKSPSARPPDNKPYIYAITVMMALGVAGAVAVSIGRPAMDNTLLIGSIFGFLAPTTLSLMAFMKAQETHLSVNSRMEEFIKEFKANATVAEDAARAEGARTGRVEGRVAADARTDALAGNSAANPVPVEIVNQPVSVKPEP